jgi:hypothetical protein
MKIQSLLAENQYSNYQFPELIILFYFFRTFRSLSCFHGFGRGSIPLHSRPRAAGITFGLSFQAFYVVKLEVSSATLRFIRSTHTAARFPVHFFSFTKDTIVFSDGAP